MISIRRIPLAMMYALIFVCTKMKGMGMEMEATQLKQVSEPETDSSEVDIEAAINNIESLALAAEITSKKGIIPLEDTEKHYIDITDTLDDIIKAVTDTKNAYKFLKAKGLTRIVAPYLNTQYTDIKTKLLILLMQLFNVAPVTTNAVIPTGILDKLLDIFENDNLALKTHALEVLAKWLPNNPQMQTRVMKIKGLEPFYKQIDKLDMSAIRKLLDLFNNILKEHLAVINKKQVSKHDSDKYFLYQRIGLVERLSTQTVCHGILNIFEVLWSYNNNDQVVKTVFELLKSVNPFCLKQFRHKHNAVGLFEALLKYVKNEEKTVNFEEIGLNITEYTKLLQDSVDKLMLFNLKDEL